MIVGMLWFERDPATSLAHKISVAMDYYMKKYHMTPNYCEVNPRDFVDAEMPIEVVADRIILPFHLWIGVKELSPNANL